MRIVKPHGTSETHFDDDGRIRRYVHPDSFPAEPVDPSVFAARHPKLVMAQWVSCIDKVVTRPHGEGLPSETQWALRNSLSKAAWDLIVEKGLLDAPAKRLKRFERQWWARIHPYGNETDPNTPRNPYGRWYRTLANGVEIADFNPETVANEIYVHLYENASRAHPEQEPRRSGLILERSDSIANSVPATTATGGGRLEPPWNATDIARYLEAGDIAASIRERLEKHHGQREAKLRHLCAAALADHLARLRCEVIDNDDGNRLPEGLFLLHEHVRRSYSDILKGNQKHLLKRLPITTDQLVALVEKKHLNREVAGLIRLGRVIHYESTPEDGLSHTSNVMDHWPEQVESSRFWLSAGQTEIKRNEAFVRIWRGVLARAARTATDWVDPARFIPRDVLGANELARAVANLTDAAFDRKAKLLFGVRSDFMTSLPLENKRRILELVLRGISRLRNSAFHFVGLKGFLASLQALDGLMDANTHDILEQIRHKDAEESDTRLFDVLRACDAQAYLSTQELKQFVATITEQPTAISELPAFRRILRRASNAWTFDKYRLTLPAPKMNKEPAPAECQRICLGLIYERAFRSWLDDLTTEKLRECVDRSVTRASIEARRVTQDDTVNARTISKFKIMEGDTLAGFFARLTASVTREIRQTEARAQPKRVATKHLEDLKCDVVAQLFEHYLREVGLGWFLSGFQARQRTGTPKTDAVLQPAIPPTPEVHAWEPVLYLLLHLVPVENTTRFAHQVGRFRDNSEIDPGLVDGLQRTLDLYRVMHDAKFAGASSGLHSEDVMAMFADTGIYADPAWENAQTIETRSLREFFRFGDHHLLAGELAQNPITLAQLQKLADVSAGVAPAQNRRSELHAEWVSNNRSLPDAKIDEYRALLGQIESIRHLSDHTELRDHLKLHSLLIDTLARLLDYAGQWERDLYFTTLALIHLAGSSPQELFQEQRGRYPIRTGQIIAALRSMRDTPGVDDIKVKLARIFEIDMPRVRGPNVQTRNELAHFNCLHAPADTIELTAMINRTRALMSYDRKQKNAVSKSVIELLDRNNVVLSWTYESGRLVEATVRPRVIRHLGHHELKERLVSTAFAEAVEGLFGSAKANTKHAQSLNARQPLC